MTGAELKSIQEACGLTASAIGKALGYSSPKANIAARIRRLAVNLAVILVAIGLPRSPALADDASALMGRWIVPSREQNKSRMSPQCQQYAETDVQTIPESEIEIFSCDDPAFAPQKTRILEFVKSVNEVYRAQNRPLYSETISGLCAVVRETTAKRKTDLCNPSGKLRGAPIENLPVVWNIRASENDEWPLAGDSYSPSSEYGAISCFKRPAAGQVRTKGCRRWGVEELRHMEGGDAAESARRQGSAIKVQIAMHKGVEWTGPDTPVTELAKLMRKHDIGAIPIGENDQLIGMVTSWLPSICQASISLARSGDDSSQAAQ